MSWLKFWNNTGKGPKPVSDTADYPETGAGPLPVTDSGSVAVLGAVDDAKAGVDGDGTVVAQLRRLTTDLAALTGVDFATESLLATVLQALGSGGDGCTIGAVTVGDSTTQILAANGGRHTVVLTGMGSEIIYIAPDNDAVMGQGRPLGAASATQPGGDLTITGHMATLEINGICASGGQSVAYVTEEDAGP